jgi:alpha-ketoglutaric semialdehyde dehydrogenase
MSETVTSFVGDWLPPAGEPVRRENPADVADTASCFVEATSQDVSAAIDLLRRKGEQWRTTSTVRSRAAVLRRVAEVVSGRADALAHAMVREEGKTYREAHSEALRAAKVFDYVAGLASSPSAETYRDAADDSPAARVHTPLGVVVAITPFNFPLLVPSFKLAPALLAGDSVAFKPSPLVSETSRLLTQAMLDAGVPPEALAMVVSGRPETVQGLVRASGVSAVSFTGSGVAGAQILQTAAVSGTRTQLEMGGSNPVLVLDTDDLAACVATIGDGAFGGTGQRCTSTRRIYVADDLMDSFVAEFTAFADAVTVGPGNDATSDLGPLATAAARSNVAGFVEAAMASPDLEMATTRPTLAANADGYFVNPTVILDRGQCSVLADRELFAPVVTVTAVHDVTDGVRHCNATPFGLAAAVWTTRTDRVHYFVRHCGAGMVSVNRSTSGIEADKPFAGLGASGYGPPELGPRSLEFYSASKTVSMRLGFPQGAPTAP